MLRQNTSAIWHNVIEFILIIVPNLVKIIVFFMKISLIFHIIGLFKIIFRKKRLVR